MSAAISVSTNPELGVKFRGTNSSELLEQKRANDASSEISRTKDQANDASGKISRTKSYKEVLGY